jgi:cytochrome bd-type quinol oxidase subunit 2
MSNKRNDFRNDQRWNQWPALFLAILLIVVPVIAIVAAVGKQDYPQALTFIIALLPGVALLICVIKKWIK